MKRAISLILLLFMTLFLGYPAMAKEKTPTITPEALQKELQSEQKLILLDVRQPQEHAAGKIEGSKLIPLGSLIDYIDVLPKDQTIVVYCRSGNRSARAVHILLNNGFNKVYNLEGGYIGWPSE